MTKSETIKEKYPFYDDGVAMKDVELNGEQVKYLMQKYKDDSVEDGIYCPFCNDDGFDRVGLKYHLETYCNEYKETK